jgi:chromosomal replication initiation ATPase DnaA
MKQDIFNQYVDRVSSLFGIAREDIFSKSKKKTLVDARHLIYYLCFKRPMQITYIQKFMGENGYNIEHSTVIYGIQSVDKKITEDRDYISVVREIEKAVFI